VIARDRRSAPLTASGAETPPRQLEVRNPFSPAVIVAGSDAFRERHIGHRREDIALLELDAGEVPAALRWPPLPDTVVAIVEDTRAAPLRSIVFVLYSAGAVVVEILAEVGGRLRAVATFDRGPHR